MPWIEDEQPSEIKIPGNPAKNISVRQNNPFNIKGPYWGATGTGARGFAIYPTPEHGVRAGINQIALDQSRGLTLAQFQEKYAPTYENPTYRRDLVKLLGVSPDTPINTIPTDTLVRAVGKLESSVKLPADLSKISKMAAQTPSGWVEEKTPSGWVEEKTPIPSAPHEAAVIAIPRIPFVSSLKKAAEEWGEEMGKSVEVPVEAAYPEMMAGEFSRGKGLSGETVKMPMAPAGLAPPAWLGPLSPANIMPRAIREEAEQQVGKLPGGKETIKDVPIDPAALGVPSGTAEYPSPATAAGVAAEQVAFAAQFGVPKILSKVAQLPLMGKASAPTVEALKVAATQKKVADKLQKNLTKGLEQYGGEAPPGVSALEQAPWKKTVKVEKAPKLPEPPPETPVELTTVNSLKNLEAGEAMQNNPANYNFKQLGQAMGFEARHRGIEPPLPPTEAVSPATSARRLGETVPPIKERWVRKNKDLLPYIEDEFQSTNMVGANRWEPTNNPIGEHFDGTIKYLDRRLRGEGWLNNVVKDTVKKIPGFKRDIRESEREWIKLAGPTFEKYLDLNTPLEEMQARIDILRSQVRNPESTQGKAIISEIEGLMKQKKAYRKRIEPQLKRIYGDRQVILDHLMEKYANIRLKLATGGNEKAISLVTDAEKEVPRTTRKYLDIKKGELEGQGLWTVGQDYTNFVYKNALSKMGSVPDTGALAFVRGLWPSKRKITPSILDFISRDPKAKDWFPLWYQSMKSYIPSVERKLAFNPWLMKWTPEAATWQFKYPRTYNWFNTFLKRQFGGEETRALNKLVNSVVNAEYLRTLYLNFAVPVLHAFKEINILGVHGIRPFLEGKYRLTKGLAQKLTGMEGLERQVLEYYVPMNRIMRMVMQEPGMSRWLKPSFWRRLPMLTTSISEYISNGTNVFATMATGRRVGADPQLIHRKILDNILRLDYSGGTMPPLFDTPGIGRPMTMYLGQPWKLAETRGDFLLKGLQGKKDEFGGSYFWKAMRMYALMGATIGAGGAAGYDLWKHVAHAPGMGIAPLTGETTFTALSPPPVQMGYELATKGPSALYKHWTEFPGISRIIRSARGETTKAYGTPWEQMFGFKKKGWEEEMRHRMEPFVKRREKYERKHRTPTQELIDNILGR